MHVLMRLKKKAANLLGTGSDQLSYEYVFTNFMKDENGNINGSVGVKYNEEQHKDLVLNYFADMMIDQAPDAMALRKKITTQNTGGSGRTEDPDFYPEKISGNIQNTFIEAFNTQKPLIDDSPMAIENPIIPLKGLENMQIKVGNSTKEIPVGGVEFDSNTFELKISEFDGEVSVLDKEGNPVLREIGEGQFVAEKTQKKNELKSYSLNDPADFAKMYNDLGTSSKARKDDYDTVGLIEAETGFIGNPVVVYEIFNNDFTKWQSRISGKPYLAKELLAHILDKRIEVGNDPKKQQVVPLDYYVKLKTRYSKIYDKLVEDRKKNK